MIDDKSKGELATFFKYVASVLLSAGHGSIALAEKATVTGTDQAGIPVLEVLDFEQLIDEDGLPFRVDNAVVTRFDTIQQSGGDLAAEVAAIADIVKKAADGNIAMKVWFVNRMDSL